MKLILIRHTEAVELGSENAPTDFDRYLTPYGKATAAKLAEVLKSQGIQLDAILSSPLVRAVQTAEPLLELAAIRQIQICEDLASGLGKPLNVAARLSTMKAEVVALVGHRPDMDQLVSWFIGAGKKGIKLDKGAAAKIKIRKEVVEKGGTLSWLITPDFYYPQVAGGEDLEEAEAKGCMVPI